MDETTGSPGQLPVPGRGSHRSVEHGACVMEYAALLSGDRHTDHPLGVHPFLATLCRQVNDIVGNEARAELVRLRQQVADQKDDLAFLKKASAYFAALQSK